MPQKMQGEVKIWTVREETQRRAIQEHKKIDETMRRRNAEERQRRIKEEQEYLWVILSFPHEE